MSRAGSGNARMAGTSRPTPSRAKGLVGAAYGRIWAENCADGGAQFTMAVPLVTATISTESAAS
jgi:hypothetical protein